MTVNKVKLWNNLENIVSDDDKKAFLKGNIFIGKF